MTASPSPTSLPSLPRALLVLAGLAVAATALTACGTDPAVSEPSGAPTASDTPSTPSDEQNPDPTSSPSGSSDEGGLQAELAEAMTSGNTAPIEGYLTEPTRVVIAASEADLQYSAVDAVLSLDYVRPGESPWDFELPSEVIDGYRASEFYGDFFPDDVIVGRADSGAVVAFVPNGALIGTIFMAADESLITG